MGKVVGECGKHPGHNFVNCPMCAIEEQQEFAKRRYFAVEYGGYWCIQIGPFYGDKDILNAEHVGAAEAEKNAKKISELLNQWEKSQRSVATELQSGNKKLST